MTRLKDYDPQQGYMYQIFFRPHDVRTWESVDYATDRADLKYLLKEYEIAYGPGYMFTWEKLPRKYWPAISA